MCSSLQEQKRIDNISSLFKGDAFASNEVVSEQVESEKFLGHVLQALFQ
jgi:anion-transporting  ArsA/GET3 family ATPase